MTALLAGAIWASLIGWLMLRLLRQFRTYRATSLGFPEGTPASLPAVAIIVPARNEIANIETCLTGLTAQRALTGGPSIVVVDDGSQDGTGEAVARVARDDPRIDLIDPGELPAGWMGKPHACWHGALRTPAESGCALSMPMSAPSPSWSAGHSPRRCGSASTCCRSIRGRSSGLLGAADHSGGAGADRLRPGSPARR